MSSSPKKFLIVAGEISGDHHAAPLMAAMKRLDPDVSFWGLGGDAMIAQGLDALYHVRDLSVTGFLEVIKHLSFFKKVMADVLASCEKNKPDAVILLDYPGFNLRLGLKLKEMGIPVFYYISPQVWAWKKGRIKTMRKFIKRIFVIFPFELDFYKEQGIPVTFTGHPLVEKDFKIGEKSEFFKTHELNQTKPLVALLPGSRRNELERHVQPLIDMLDILDQKRPDIQYLVAGLSSLSPGYYEPLKSRANVRLIMDDSYPMTAHADLAVVASGTATLETAYLGTPLIVYYRIAPLSYLIGKVLVDIEHLAMPNLIAGERVAPELIQGDAHGTRMAEEVLDLLENDARRKDMSQKLNGIKQALGEPGCADIIAAQIYDEVAP